MIDWKHVWSDQITRVFEKYSGGDKEGASDHLGLLIDKLVEQAHAEGIEQARQEMRDALGIES